MAYADTQDKRDGLENEEKIRDKILQYFRSKNYLVEAGEHSSFEEDTQQKWDYPFFFDPTTPFGNKQKVLIDVKYANSFTFYDTLGNNTLRNSISDFIVYQFPRKENELLFINTEQFKKCLMQNFPTDLITSKHNPSRFFPIEKYLENNKNFSKNLFKYVQL